MRWLRVSGALVMGAGLLLPGVRLYAQRGGGGGGMGGGVPTAGAGRPGGVEEKDELKGFHRAMAVQVRAFSRDREIPTIAIGSESKAQLGASVTLQRPVLIGDVVNALERLLNDG